MRTFTHHDEHEVTQAIDLDRSGRFVKSRVTVSCGASLAMVRKRSARRATAGAPVMLVHGLGQNRYAWHLGARSLANHIADAGRDVFNVDLRGHGRSTDGGGADSLHRYVDDLCAAGEAVRALTGEAPTLVGHSLGGLISYRAAARAPEAFSGVASLAAPYDFGAGNAAMRALRWALSRGGEVSSRARARRLPYGAVWALFRGAREVWDAPRLPLPVRAWRPGAFEPAVLDEYLSLAFDRGYLGELVDLARGDALERERFEALTLPLLVVAGEHDLLAPPASVLPAYVRSRSPSRRYAALPFGHGDLLLGRDAPRLTWSALDAGRDPNCDAGRRRR